MAKQISFAKDDYDTKRKKARRDPFLYEMEIVVPRTQLLEQWSPHYDPTAGQGLGHRPIGLGWLLGLCHP